MTWASGKVVFFTVLGRQPSDPDENIGTRQMFGLFGIGLPSSNSNSTEPVEFLSNTGVGWTTFPASVCRNSVARASRHRVAFNIMVVNFFKFCKFCHHAYHILRHRLLLKQNLELLQNAGNS